MCKLKVLLVVCFVVAIGGVCYADLADGLVAHYPFNGNADDESGNGNHGTVYGATLTSDRLGHPDSAYSFNGFDDYINIGANVKPPFPISVCAWVKLDEFEPGRSNCVFRNDHYDSSNYRWGIAMFIGETGTVSVNYCEGFSAPSNRRSIISVEPLISLGEWHLIAVVIPAHTVMHLFVDGYEVDATTEGTGSGMSYSSDDGALATYQSHPGGTTYYLDGDLDDIRVYDRALSAEEIEELFPGTVLADLTCIPSSGTLPFATQITVSMTNLYTEQIRRIAGRIGVAVGSGSVYANWRAGFANIASGGTYTSSWNQNIPNFGTLVGDNVFTLVAEDVTPSPYNQPPYPPAGDTDTASCTVTGIAP